MCVRVACVCRWHVCACGMCVRVACVCGWHVCGWHVCGWHVCVGGMWRLKLHVALHK